MLPNRERNASDCRTTFLFLPTVPQFRISLREGAQSTEAELQKALSECLLLIARLKSPLFSLLIQAGVLRVARFCGAIVLDQSKFSDRNRAIANFRVGGAFSKAINNTFGLFVEVFFVFAFREKSQF